MFVLLGRSQLSVTQAHKRRRLTQRGVCNASVKIHRFRGGDKFTLAQETNTHTHTPRRPDREVYIISLGGQPEPTPSLNFHDSQRERAQKRREPVDVDTAASGRVTSTTRQGHGQRRDDVAGAEP